MRYIFYLAKFLFFANTLYSQKTKIYISPIIGIQMPFSKVITNNYSKGILTNNRIEADPLFGLKLETVLNNDNILFLSYQNGISGYSIKADSKPCSNYNGNFSIVGKASAFNNKRLNLGYQFSINRKGKNDKGNLYLKSIFVIGLAIDIKGNENDTAINLGNSRLNRCGELYYLEDVVPVRKPISISIPFGFNFEVMKKHKRKLTLSLIYNQGLTVNTIFQVDYVTNTYRDSAFLRSKGSGFSLAMSFPIKIK